MSSSGKSPVARFGKELRITAWRARNGGLSFSIEKSYKDKEKNEWVKTNVYWDLDLEALKKLIDEALAFNKQDRANRDAHSKPAGEFEF